MRRHLRAVLAGVLVVLSILAPAAIAEEQRRFLVIYSAHSALSANVEATEGMTAVLDRRLGADYELYAEYRDDQRFPGPEADVDFVEEMARKYGGQPFDAILAFGASALIYALAHRSELEGDVPIVFGGIGGATLAEFDLPTDAHGIRSTYSVAGTLELARRLQPRAKRAVVLTGSGAFDRSWEENTREALAGVGGLPIDYVSGLTLEGFEEFAASLDRDTILLILTVFSDASGRSFTPVNAAELIARSAAAPSWSVYDTFVGRGIVGGEVQRFEDVGAAMAAQVLRLVDGETGVEPILDVPTRFVVDWRQMQRFGLDRDLLPPGTLLQHYEPSPWERYRTPILLASAIILAQMATIAALVIQGRRRNIAEQEVAARRVELAHMSRVAQLGELSGALAHELNQPLTSILANAEAGAQLARRDPVDLEELAAILEDIADDDRRAAGIIVELRRLMTKGETKLEPLDLNEMVEATVLLARSEFLVRRVDIDLRLAREALSVHGSRAQLKQVILNLLLNAADAMAEQPVATRRISISTRQRADGWREIAVEDRGPGLAPDVVHDPFRPFVTTKAYGLGLGLSICRTIAQSHGGTLRFETERKQGALAILALPPP